MTSLSGKTLGQYQLHEELGRGGMATVYRATQTSIGREVAIKVLPAHFLQEPTFLERFNREVQVIAQLQHMHILPVYDFGKQDGMPYIVMAYMPGGTLSDLLRGQPLSLERSVELVTQIAAGLDHAHNKGIIHRDFKPGNVLLDEYHNTFLADFGIARVTDATKITGTGMLVGTPAYMAPEMYQGGVISASVDIYALGIALYCMLCGKLPYQAELPAQYMMAHLNKPIPDLRSLRPDLPDSIQYVIESALAKSPTERYPSAGSGHKG